MSFESELFAYIEQIKNQIRAQPLNLGGVSTGGGGPAGGYVGYLPQSKVSFDIDELEEYPSVINPSGLPSGISLVTNLNRIRYRLGVLEDAIASGITVSGTGGSITVKQGANTYNNVTILEFDGSVTSTAITSGVKITISGGTGSGVSGPVEWDDVLNKPTEFTPSAHAITHQSTGSDAIKLDDLEPPDDNTDLDVSTDAHGLMPKLPNDATKFLNGVGQWVTVSGTTTSGTTSSGTGSITVTDGSTTYNNVTLIQLSGIFLTEAITSGVKITIPSGHSHGFNRDLTSQTGGTTYSLSGINYSPGSLAIYRNGVRLPPTDYSETAGGFTTNYVVPSGDSLIVDLQIGSGGAGGSTGGTTSSGTTFSGIDAGTIYFPLARPATVHSADDEFDNESFNTSKWTEFDVDGIQTITEEPAGLKLASTTSSASDNYTGIYQALPDSTCTITTRVSLAGRIYNFHAGGIALFQGTPSATSDFMAYNILFLDTGFKVEYSTWSDYKTISAGVFGDETFKVHSAFLRLRKTPTQIEFDYSHDGLGWHRFYQELSPMTGLTHMGLVLNNYSDGSSQSRMARFSFFRYKASDVGMTAALEGRRIKVFA